MLSSRCFRTLAGIALAVLLSACAKTAVIDNRAAWSRLPAQSYSLANFGNYIAEDGTAIVLSFSGGGTRAAALAYGVLQELHNTPADPESGLQTLLEQVDTISSVSGGSFTAAYYGLHGAGIFHDFEPAFLRKDIQSSLVSLIWTPTRWFQAQDRTDAAIRLYDDEVFKGATFSQMMGPNKPLILINSSDLAGGVRFSFLQEYFSLLCSDLRDFSVARAVAASSAVPLLFHPIVLKNHDECGADSPAWLKRAARGVNRTEDAEQEFIVQGLRSYANKDARKFIHFVDGGITDNLGLRAIYDVMELAGGAKALKRALNAKPPKRFVVIAVDASTNTSQGIDDSADRPSMSATLNAISDVQLNRYNVSTIELFQRALKHWTADLSDGARTVEPYFIRVSLQNTTEKQRQKLNAIPTSFSISDDDVDLLIDAGRSLLRDDPTYQSLLLDMGLQ